MLFQRSTNPLKVQAKVCEYESMPLSSFLQD